MLKPEALMVSTPSTVIEFLTPDTFRLAQWPVITTWLEIPLTVIALWLQAMVRLSLIPEMVRLSPAGAVGAAVAVVDDAGPDVCAALAEGPVVLLEMLGIDGMLTKPPWVARWMPKTARPSGTAIVPMMKKAAKIHPSRLRELGRGDAHGAGLP